MKNLKNWAINKPVGIVILAQFAASGIEACFDYLNLFKNNEYITGDAPPPSSEKWLYLYKNHRHVQKVLIETFKSFGGIAEIGAFGFELFSNKQLAQESIEEFNNSSIEEKKEILTQAIDILEDIYLLSLEDIQADFEGQHDDVFISKFKKAIQTPEMFFFYNVICPSFFIYGEHPTKLLRRARLGNPDDIKKMLLLDESTLKDPFIFEHFHKLSKKSSRHTFDSIVDAIRKKPIKNNNFKKMKYKIAGFISVASEAMRYRLTAPEIEKLFHAIAVDFEIKELIDLTTDDIYSESIATAVRRERKFWEKYFYPDKK